VALQLPDLVAEGVPQGRLERKFPSNTTLWLLLRAFESTEGKNFNFTQRGIAQTESGSSGAGRILYEMPVVNVAGREISSINALQKTIAQLGFNSGRCLIRLAFRKIDKPLEEAMSEIGQYFKTTDTDTDTGPTTSTGAAETTFESDTKMADHLPESAPIPGPTPPPAPQDSSKNQVTLISAPSSSNTIIGPGDRPISVYAPPSSDTPRAALLPHNEKDYEPTITHMKRHHDRLKENSMNKRLLSDAEEQKLAEEKAAKQSTIKKLSIKVMFPDQTSIHAPFTDADTGLSLYEFVCSTIVAENQPFALIFTGPRGQQTVPKDTKILLVKNLGFGERMLVRFHWEDGVSAEAKKSPVLKEQYAKQAQDLLVQEVVAAETEEAEEQAAVNANAKGKESSKGAGKSSGGKPKWFTMGKK